MSSKRRLNKAGTAIMPEMRDNTAGKMNSWIGMKGVKRASGVSWPGASNPVIHDPAQQWEPTDNETIRQHARMASEGRENVQKIMIGGQK
jgi:hypothetical protein